MLFSWLVRDLQRVISRAGQIGRFGAPQGHGLGAAGCQQNLQKTAVFAYCIFICLSSWQRFGTVGTSSSFTNTNLNYRSASLNLSLIHI